jgi:hypothetical protein
MKLQFSDIIGKHLNVPALVIAHGPSLNDYLSRLEDLKQKGFIIIDCNNYYDFHKIKPDYLCFASNYETIAKKIDHLNICHDSTIIYANSVDFTDDTWIQNNLKCNYVAYDQRHFQHKNCNELMGSNLKDYGGYTINGQCCQYIDKNRITIQEELQKLTGYYRHYKTGDTIALHEIALAVLLKCNPIYFIGIDLNYHLGYANNFVDPIIEKNHFDIYNHRIFEDLKIIKESANNIGIEIINLNKNSTFDLFNTGKI